MDMKKVIDDIKQDKMHCLSDYYIEMLEALKCYDERLYHKIKMETYALAYGYKFNEDLAKAKVKAMKPVGEYWTMEQTTSVGTQAGVDFNKVKKCTWYYVMNMMYNDYNGVLGSDVNMYVKMSKAWLDDVDSPYCGDEKTFRYAML